MNFRIILFLLALTGLNRATAQFTGAADREMGHPLSRTYLPVEYDAHGQNFAISQDRSGIMYFGNFAGVLEYDGVTWKTIQTENVTRVSALALDKRGRILVGANGEFGYLAYDTLGVHRFVSLSNKIKGDIGSILQIVETKRGILFISDKQIFVWNGKKVTVQKYDFRIQSAFAYKDKLLIFSKNKGLLLMDGESVAEVGKGDGVPVLLDMVSLVPQSDGSALMLTTSQGLFKFSGTQVENIGGNINEQLIRNKATFANKLQDNSVAISMMNGGLLVISPDGEILYPVISEGAVQDSQVTYMFNDRDHNLWLALNDGLAKINIPSPISRFDNGNGLKGEVTSIGRFQEKLFVGTLYGLFYIEDNVVVKAPGFSGSCLAFQRSGNALLIATSKGLVSWENGRSVNLTNDFTLNVTVPVSNSGLAYVSLQDGLGVLKKNNSAWKFERIKAVNEQIVGISEFPSGTLWLETLSGGIINLDVLTNQVKRFSAAQGIASPLYNKLSFYKEKLFVSNKDGLFEYQPARGVFTRSGMLGTRDTWFDRVQEDENGNIWTTRGDKKSVALFRKKTGKTGFEKVEAPFLPIAEVPFQVIYPDRDQIAWVGGSQGLYRLDMKVKKQYSYKYPVLLRNFFVGDSSILSRGNGIASEAGSAAPVLTYKQNSISIEYALPSYHINQDVQYQYFLENYDKGWSEWSPLTRKEYSGLPYGNYVFKVRAKDIYNNVSQEAAFPFTILTPWFWQWYAIILYAILFSVVIYYAVRWRLRRILKEKQGLENLIRERTEEVVNQKEELEQQSDELSATNDQLERIDEFVKSINGEVNTGKLFQLVLNRLCGFQNVDGASALVYNKATNNYQFIALAGSVELADVEDVSLTYEQTSQRYMEGSVEVHEDIFLKNNFRFENLNNSIDDLFAPKSLITIVIRVEGEVKSFITLENMDHENAFQERDFSMVKNLKEHLIGAYIKTNILENLENTLTNLKSTQEELIRQERLASVGQLTKGIVDRILNPLNYINNFSQSSGQLLTEIAEVTDKHLDEFSEDERDDLDSGMVMLRRNLEKIYEHGNSTTRIVKDMQKLLKGKSTEFLVTELNPFLESKSRSAFQEVLNEYKGATVDLSFELLTDSLKVSLLPFEFSQVLTNLISNACYAVIEKGKTTKGFEPKVVISTALIPTGIGIRVRDNGRGIPPKEIEQLFSPFFTTKPTSKGTGLGLYMSKDIIEYHKGRMTVNSKEGEFTEFNICLPIVM